MKNYYTILEIKSDASSQEIKKAYRRLAMKYHPDHSSYSKSEDLFNHINEAYSVLSDPYTRAAYDGKINPKTKEKASTTAYHSPVVDRERRRRGTKGNRSRYRTRNYSGKDIEYPWVKPYLKYARLAFIIGISISVIMVPDSFLEISNTRESIREVSYNVVYTIEGSEIKLHPGDAWRLSMETEIIIYRSGLLARPYKIKIPGAPKSSFSCGVPPGPMKVVSLFLVFTSVIGLARKTKPEITFSNGIMAVILILISLSMLM